MSPCPARPLSPARASSSAYASFFGLAPFLNQPSYQPVSNSPASSHLPGSFPTLGHSPASLPSYAASLPSPGRPQPQPVLFPMQDPSARRPLTQPGPVPRPETLLTASLARLPFPRQSPFSTLCPLALTGPLLQKGPPSDSQVLVPSLFPFQLDHFSKEFPLHWPFIASAKSHDARPPQAPLLRHLHPQGRLGTHGQ